MTGIIDYAHTKRALRRLAVQRNRRLDHLTLIYEDVASVCPTLMLDETRSGSFATHSRFRTQALSTDLAEGIWHPELESVSLDEANRELHRSPKHMPTTSRMKPKWFQWSTWT